MNDRFQPHEPEKRLGVVLVDHGSLRDESNAIVVEVADRLRREAGFAIVEAAHMELAEPSLSTAFTACAKRGARHIVVVPYFLGPGCHVEDDIPRLAAKAAGKHPHVTYVVAAPLGLHSLIVQIVGERASACLSSGQAKDATCENHENPPAAR